MPLTLAVPLIAASAVALSACGSSSSSGSHPASKGPGRPVRTYRVVLTGKGFKPAGAPQGSGAVVIALHHRAVVCYRFAHLRGFSTPTAAYLAQGAKGQQGKVVLHFSRGTTVHHKGCIRGSRALGAALEHNAGSYYVTISTKQYPRGAVRGQL